MSSSLVRPTRDRRATVSAPATSLLSPQQLDAQALPPAVLADPDRMELASVVRAAELETVSAPAVAAALWWKRYAWFVVQAAIEGWYAGAAPDLDPWRSRVRIADGPPYVEVHPAGTSTVNPDDDRVCAGWLAEEVVGAHLAPILERLHELTRSGRRVLWGSVTHAIAYPVFVRRRGDLEGRTGATYAAVGAEAFVDSVGAPVAGLIGFVAGSDGEPEIRRRTCCLAFRSGTPIVCGYCPITTARERGDSADQPTAASNELSQGSASVNVGTATSAAATP